MSQGRQLNVGLALLGSLLWVIGPVVISVYFIKAGPLATAYHPEVAPIDLWDTLPTSQKALRGSVMCEHGNFTIGEFPSNTTDLIRCNMEDNALDGIRVLGTYLYPAIAGWRYLLLFGLLCSNGSAMMACVPFIVLGSFATSSILISLLMVANFPPEYSGWEVRSTIPAAVWVAARVDLIFNSVILALLLHGVDPEEPQTVQCCGIPLPCAQLFPALAFLAAPIGMVQYAYFEDAYWYLIAVPMHYLIWVAMLFWKLPRSLAALYFATEFTLCTVLFYSLGGADRPPGSFLLPAETWSGMLFFSLISPVMLPVLIFDEMAERSYTGSNLLRLWHSPSPPRVALAATYALCAGMVLYIHVSESDSENLPFVIALFPVSLCFIDQLLDDPVVGMFAHILRPLPAFFIRILRAVAECCSKGCRHREKAAAAQDSEGTQNCELPAKVSAPKGGEVSSDAFDGV